MESHVKGTHHQSSPWKPRALKQFKGRFFVVLVFVFGVFFPERRDRARLQGGQSPAESLTSMALSRTGYARNSCFLSLVTPQVRCCTDRGRFSPRLYTFHFLHPHTGLFFPLALAMGIERWSRSILLYERNEVAAGWEAGLSTNKLME